MIKNSLMKKIAVFVCIVFMFTSIVSAETGFSAVEEVNSSIISLPSNGVKGQVSVGIKGLTLINNSINAESIQTTTYADGQLSKIRPEAAKLEQNSKYFTYVRYSVIEGTNNTVSGEVRVTSPETITLVDAISGEGYKIYERTGNTIPIDNLTFYGPSTDEGSGRIAAWEDFIFIDMTALGIEDYTEEQMLELARMGYWEGTKSTVRHRLKSVGKNLIDIKNNQTFLNSSEASFVTEEDISCLKISDGVNMFNKVLVDNIFEENTQYTLTYTTKYTGNSTPRLRIVYKDSTVTDVNVPTTSFVKRTTTSASGKTIDYITFVYGSTPHELFISVDDFQLEKGITSTVYEEYKESISYITLPEGNELRSLSNNVKDEVKDGKLYKRTESYTLQSSDIIQLSTTNTNYDHVQIVRPNLTGIYSQIAGATPSRLIIPNFVPNQEYSGGSFVDTSTYIGTYVDSLSASTNIILFFAKGTYVDLNAAQADLAGKSLIYQLATEQVIDIPTTPLIGYPKGTIIIEPAVSEGGVYDGNITINNSDLPIESIESVKRINSDSTRTMIDLSNITIAADGKSFTITGSADGESYEYEYMYPQELTTIPTISYSVPIDQNGQISGNTNMIQQNSELIDLILQEIQLLRDEINTMQ